FFILFSYIFFVYILTFTIFTNYLYYTINNNYYCYNRYCSHCYPCFFIHLYLLPFTSGFIIKPSFSNSSSFIFLSTSIFTSPILIFGVSFISFFEPYSKTLSDNSLSSSIP